MTDLLAKFAGQLQTNPYSAYHVIRKLDPVHWSPSWQSWFLTRYEDVAAVLKDTRFSVSRVSDFSGRGSGDQDPRPLQRIEAELQKLLLFQDPPAHTRLRGLITKAFTPKSVEQLAPVVEQRVRGLLARLDGPEFDVMAGLATPLPVMTIADFLGSRPEDHGLLQRWSHDLASFLGNETLSPEVVAKADEALTGLREYFAVLLKERQQSPAEDLMTRLIQAQEAGQRLTEDEILSMCTLLFAAGHDTTTNLIGNSLLATLQHPKEMSKGVPVEKVVEEVLRYDSPSLVASRHALEDVELGGKLIKKGDAVNLCLGAANRDPAKFPDPDRFLVDRDNSDHIAFGRGLHFCVGSFLAKLETRFCLKLFWERFPNARLKRLPERYPTVAFRRLKWLEVQA